MSDKLAEEINPSFSTRVGPSPKCKVRTSSKLQSSVTPRETPRTTRAPSRPGKSNSTAAALTSRAGETSRRCIFTASPKYAATARLITVGPKNMAAPHAMQARSVIHRKNFRRRMTDYPYFGARFLMRTRRSPTAIIGSESVWPMVTPTSPNWYAKP